MKSYVFVQDHPYVAFSGKDGKFTLANLPIGNWTLRFWQEKAGYVDEVTIGGKKQTWKKGRLEVNVTGDQDMGKIELAPAVFE